MPDTAPPATGAAALCIKTGGNSQRANARPLYSLPPVNTPTRNQNLCSFPVIKESEKKDEN
jgi:hypothetical protein